MVEICNLRNSVMCNKYDVRVDRRSALGNPFYMNYEFERNEVCDKYEEWFKKQLAEGTNYKFLEELRAITMVYQCYGKIRLFCWCYPKRCHAETIKKFLEGEL